MARPHKCPYCEKQETVSKGRRRTKTMGDRWIRLCKACGRKFTPKNQKSMEPSASVPAGQAATVEMSVAHEPSVPLQSMTPPLEETVAVPSEPAGQLEKSLTTNEPGN